jgi:transcription initiation factor TFIIB
MSSADKALRSGYDAIRQMAGRIALSNRIITRAFSLFKQCYENKCVRGRSQDAIVATCIYIACRQEGAQRTIKGKLLGKIHIIY